MGTFLSIPYVCQNKPRFLVTFDVDKSCKVSNIHLFIKQCPPKQVRVCYGFALDTVPWLASDLKSVMRGKLRFLGGWKMLWCMDSSLAYWQGIWKTRVVRNSIPPQFCVSMHFVGIPNNSKHTLFGGFWKTTA